MKPDAVAALAITNQRETVIAWDSETGVPVHPALVWQDERGTDACHRLLESGSGEEIQLRTGLVVDTYFSASKLQWMVENVPDCRRAADAGTLMAGTMDTWVIWNLTERHAFVTDYSNASRTLLFNIETCQWDDKLRDIFNVRSVRLPEVRFSDEPVGTFRLEGSTREIPIVGIMGDSHAALFGHAGFSPGDAKTTFGTGSSVMMNIGPRFRQSPAGVVSSIAWGTGSRVSYVFEGNIHSTGDTVRWVRDQLQLFSDYKISDIGPLSRLGKLTGLFLEHNEIEDIRPLKNLKQLPALDLSNNRVHDISPLEGDRKITWLNLSNNEIADIATLRHCAFLTVVNLDANNISDLSPLKQVCRLRVLSANDNLLAQLPELGRLSSLRSLLLSRNKLTAIELVTRLPELTQLDLSANTIRHVGFLGYTPNLQTLNLSENPIDDPTPVFRLRELRSLYLWHTGISHLEGVGGLKKLKELGVADNHLEEIGEVVHMQGIDLLFLGGNHTIPSSQLEKLKNNLIKDLRGPQWKEL